MLVEIINNTLYILEFVVVSSLWFGMHHKITVKGIIGLEIVLAVLTVILCNMDNVELQLFFSIMYVSVAMCIMYSENNILLIIYSMAMTSALSMVNLISGMLVSDIASLIRSGTLDIPLYNIFRMIISLFFLTLIGIIVHRKFKKGFRTLGFKYIFLFSVVLIVESGVVIMLGEDAIKGDSDIYRVMYMLTIIGVFVQIGTIILLVLSRNVSRENEILMKKYLNEQTKHYSYLENKERETKKFRHDLRNHMHTLMTLYNEQKYDEVHQYLETINGRIDELRNCVSVGNGIADAVLNQYYEEAEIKGILLKVIGHFPVKCTISAFDLCTILSNLLSNAVRAEEEYGGKVVLVQFGYTDTEILINMENDYKDISKDKSGKFKSSKRDSTNHGFGLENVRECVRRNHGYMDIQADGGKFKLILSLVNVADVG